MHAAPPPPFAALCGELLSQGAEACIYACTYLGQPAVLKHRLAKAYRHPMLDARLCKERLLGESRATARARRLGIPVPILYLTDAPTGCLLLERIAGPTVKAWLQAGGAGGAHAERVAAHVGATIARLHAAGLAHGDLTTSNLMLRGSQGCAAWGAACSGAAGGAGEAWGLPAARSVPAAGTDPADEAEEEGGAAGGGGGGGGEEEELLLGLSGLGAGAGAAGAVGEDCAGPTATSSASAAAAAAAPAASAAPPLPPLPPAVAECVIIDFGLACQNASLEDMGVDLYVLERALSSAHAKDAARLFAAILSAYTAHLTAIAPKAHHGAAAVAAKFSAVRQRGRKRVAFG